MQYFEIIGLFSSFIGSVLLGVSYIKPLEQIKDETASYFGSNPYTYESHREEFRISLIGISFLIVGFSTVLGGAISSVLKEGVLVGALISALFSVVGLASIPALLLHRTRKHTHKKINLAKEQFVKTVRIHRHDLRNAKENLNFKQYQDTFKSNLEKRLNEIPDEYSDIERQHLSDILSSKDIEDMKTAIQDFLDS